jgi:hypothetical protein
MASHTQTPPPDPIRDLAADIYVEIVCRNIVVTENAAQIKSNPESLARISFRLAEAFQRIHTDINAPNQPKNQEYDMKAAELPGFKSPGS